MPAEINVLSLFDSSPTVSGPAPAEPSIGIVKGVVEVIGQGELKDSEVGEGREGSVIAGDEVTNEPSVAFLEAVIEDGATIHHQHETNSSHQPIPQPPGSREAALSSSTELTEGELASSGENWSVKNQLPPKVALAKALAMASPSGSSLKMELALAEVLVWWLSVQE